MHTQPHKNNLSKFHSDSQSGIDSCFFHVCLPTFHKTDEKQQRKYVIEQKYQSWEVVHAICKCPAASWADNFHETCGRPAGHSHSGNYGWGCVRKPGSVNTCSRSLKHLVYNALSKFITWLMASFLLTQAEFIFYKCIYLFLSIFGFTVYEYVHLWVLISSGICSV